jgi:transposase
MVKLKDKLEILMRHNKYGEGIRKIARETGISRNTVRDYIREFEKEHKKLTEQEPATDTLSIIDTIVEKPKYDSGQRTRDVMKEEFIAKIKQYISENEYKRQNGLGKQCMTAQDMHEDLIKIGYNGSYPTTCIYVRSLRNNAREAFIKQVYEFGDICEFDWGDVKLMDKNKIKTFKMAVFTSAKNNTRTAFLYRREDTQAFIDAHARFFEITKGVFKTMVYDNMKVAVAKFAGVHEKEPTEALKKLSLFYGFNYRFCNIYCGNEKGHVERSVDFVRRKAFSRKIDFAFEEAGAHLEKVLAAHNANGLEEERPYLLPYPGKYETAEIKECFVDKYSVISYSNNKYSVPDHLVGKYVCLKAYVEEIIVLHGKEKIAGHKRLYGSNEWSVNIYHYVRTISRKPGALKGSLALSQLQDDLKQIYIKYFKEAPKEFIKVLELTGSLGKDKVLTKIHELASSNIPVNLDNIKAIALRKNDAIDDDNSAVAMLSAYDLLYNTGGKAI